ncbi:MAG: hypothetical protein F9K26_10330 [Ignavibacteriaceae bacterium]|nr:MAG: hypothetical protein F9K26_10330 [Ignavibacteriaceae bacterium]MBW7873648.1 hypothetical protein [Ignavibacteria bacterium]MBZ0197508.1 hypothetical protein [Ignavibacteriaceae bacterium]OQY74863.1 MAG: hypothetical protein B6D45_06255 [Ignavibacteriales bacterium UTCHB3]
MVLEVVVTKSDDGYTAEIPSINGCETWAHTEDEVIEKILEQAMFYLKIDDLKRLKLDKSRGDFSVTVYKLIC